MRYNHSSLLSRSLNFMPVILRGFWEHVCCVMSSILFACFLVTSAHAQDLPAPTASAFTGEQPYESYHGGDIDSINLSNGRLALNFPLLTYPQRGALHLSFNLMYNNQPQHYYAPSTIPPIYWYWGGGPPSANLPLENGDVFVGWAQQVTFMGESVVKTVGSDIYNYWVYNVVTADGAQHVLGDLGIIDHCGTSPGPYTEVQTGPFESLDATGWNVSGGFNCTTTPSPTITDSAGVHHQINGAGDTVVDPNGNEITLASSTIRYTSATFTDSLGRQIAYPPNINSTSNTSTSNCPVTPGIPATSAVSWTVPGYNGQNATYTFCYASFSFTNPNIDGPGGMTRGGTGNATRLQSTVLPNGQSWQFQYGDAEAGLTQVTLPTGGTISYTYTTAGGGCGTQPSTSGRWVASRTVNANDGTGAHTWTYTYNSSTVVTDPLGNDVVHTFGYNVGCVSYETQTQYYQGSHTSGTLLKTVNTSYSGSTESSNTAPYLGINVVPVSVSTVWPNGQTSTVTESYDSGFNFNNYQGTVNASGTYGKVVTETESDYGSGGAGTILRTTNTSYGWQSNSNYVSNNLLNLTCLVTVYGTGSAPTQPNCTPPSYQSNQASQTTYGYDESGLVSSGVSEQKTTPEAYPGNQTSVHRWQSSSTTATTNCNVSVSNGSLTSTKVYYNTGEVNTSTDPCGNTTTSSYANEGNGYGTSTCSAIYYYGGYLTSVKNALGQTTYYCYDFDTGAVINIQDPNLQITAKNYDILARLISVNYPDGGSTTYCYTDGVPSACSSGNSGSAPLAVVATKAITASLNEISSMVFDGLGRISQTQLNSDPSGVDYVDTTYDLDGRKSTVSNSHRSSSSTTDGITGSIYDGLGRVCVVVQPDGTQLSQSSGCPTTAPTGDVFTQYIGPCTTVTDEAGNSRQSCVDGLGRMTSVLEDPGSSPHLNYSTTYAYNALGDLTGVTQNGSNSSNARARSFSYDSLSELTSATNPESGTITYAYDGDGNVVTKTAPLPNQTGSSQVTITHTYDKLNRLTGKTYKDGGTTDPYTPPVQYGYDGVALTGCTITPPGDPDTYPTGKRTSMCDGSGGASWKHDKMGRILQERRTIGSASGEYDTDAYNLDGSVQSITALGYSLGYNYNAAGQPIKVENPADPFNYVTSTTYAPTGGVTALSLGAAPITVTNAYNDRLQPILLSAKTTSATLFSECFDFHLGVAVNTAPCSFSAYTTGDNGNVFQIVNNRDNTRTQSFTYDVLNRIKSGQSSGTQWGETFSIDAWGNLTNESAISGKTNHEGLNTTAGTNNRLSGYGYDAAGNMTSNGSASYVYDAENRLIATAGTSYIYDGDGNRVEKCTEGSTPGTCSSGATGTLYWRGMADDPEAETDLSGNVLENYIFFDGQRIARRDASTKAVHFYFSDHLGSHGVVENATGTVCEQDIDYYPYGGQENDYCPTVVQHYKFTGKERDSESGLDMFGARYYGSSLGRFMTPDWAAKPITVPYANFGNPQSLNLYSYVTNNPLTLLDDDGHDIIYAAGLQNAQLVKDSVQAILANPNTSANLSGYVGPNNPNLTIQSGDLSAGDTRTVSPDGQTVTTTTVQGNTAPDIQTTSGSSTFNGVTTTEPAVTTLTGATITIDNRTSKGDTPGVMVHESVHAGEAKANPGQFSKDAAAEKSLPHDQRPQEQRANAAQKAFGNEIKKEVKQIQKDRKKDDQ